MEAGRSNDEWVHVELIANQDEVAKANSTSAESCKHPILNARLKLLDAVEQKKSTIRHLRAAKQACTEFNEILVNFVRLNRSDAELEQLISDIKDEVQKLSKKMKHDIGYIMHSIKDAKIHDSSYSDTNGYSMKMFDFVMKDVAKKRIHNLKEEWNIYFEFAMNYLPKITRATSSIKDAMAKKKETALQHCKAALELYEQVLRSYYAFTCLFPDDDEPTQELSSIEDHVKAAVVYEWNCFFAHCMIFLKF